MNKSTVCRKHLTHILFLIIIFFMISSVTLADSNHPGYMADIYCHDGPYAIRLPKSLKALRSIGKLKSERIIRIDKVMGTEDRELIYEGLRLIIVTCKTCQPDYIFSRVNITSPSWNISANFRVGDTVESIEKRLDGKIRKVDDWLEVVGGGSDELRFRISNGKVVEIEYLCYIG
ncbi:MAG: hypothetical protein MUP30_01030 [Deltaproteobacteria bacterium]|nr:hypothetical protein [Deltaproteobacteria bacterium]